MEITPHFSVFSANWADGKNQALSADLVSDLETPVSAMIKLCHDKKYSFLLESMEGDAVRGRYSIIGRDPDLIWRCQRGGKVFINRHVLTKPDDFVVCKESPLPHLKALLKECHIDDVGQPSPMASGLFGYLGYDMVRYMERIPDDKPVGVDVDEAILIRPTLLAIFDQVENKFALVAPVWFDKNLSAKEAYEQAKQRLERAKKDLEERLPAEKNVSQKIVDDGQATSNMTEDKFVSMVKKAKEYINAGDIFQVVLSQRFSRPFALPPFSLYRTVRRLDPSPFLFFFNLNNFSIVGSSPEILVRVRNGKVTIRPIAGTRPRGQGNQTDQELEKDLLSDQKELAEHLMLLDLGRNDVGRVAKIGSVKVTVRNTIEYYKHVMHIVSNVEGELDKSHTPLEALIGGFPAGTVSGSPKIRAMEVISELEPDRRGVYAGCIGYFGANGTMDTAIAIRTAVIKDDIMHVQAGAGIVYDSEPLSEYRECLAKARGMLRAAEETIMEFQKTKD